MERFCVGVTCTQKNYETIQAAIKGNKCWKIDGILPSEDSGQYTLFWYWTDQHLVEKLRQTLLTDAIATYVCENGAAYTEHYGNSGSLNHPCDFGIFFHSNPTISQVYGVSNPLWIEFPNHSVILLTEENISLYSNMVIKELKVKLHGLTACVFS